MSKLKRIIAMVLTLTISVVSCVIVASATESRASDTLSSYAVTLASGDASGELDIKYSVRPTGRASSVGISSIRIYESDGSYVTTISGSSVNGLVAYSSYGVAGTYTYEDVTPGVSYYAVATVFASVDGERDSKVVTTADVVAP